MMVTMAASRKGPTLFDEVFMDTLYPTEGQMSRGIWGILLSPGCVLSNVHLLDVKRASVKVLDIIIVEVYV